jgi:hypothetical protein
MAVNPDALGVPIAFISHSWKYKIKDLLDALINYFGRTACIWIDIFCNNQHKAPDLSFYWWSCTFRKAISSIGKTVMVFAPWNDPIPLTRGWCIWELYCTIDQEGCAFDVAMTPESESCFVTDMDADPTKMINRMLATIDCEKIECCKIEDKNQIHDAIKSTIGFSEMNKRIFEVMRNWVIARYEKEKEKRKKELGGTNLSFSSTLSNLAELYETQGNFNKAAPLYEECLEIRKSTLGETHPLTLSSLNNLAVLYNSQGSYDKAVPLYQQCVDVLRPVLGKIRQRS